MLIKNCKDYRYETAKQIENIFLSIDRNDIEQQPNTKGSAPTATRSCWALAIFFCILTFPDFF